MTPRLHTACAKATGLIALLMALSAPVTASVVQTFPNPAAITIPAIGNASPYPSTITVSGVPTNFTRLEVQLNGFTHSFPDDVDVLLVGPQGQRAILMSDAGGPGPGVVTGQTLTFAQTAANPIPDATAPASGLFRPANYIESAGSSSVDTFPTPGPGALTDAPADLFAFNGFNPNGTWRLFVVDDANGDFGSVSGGWTLRFTAPTVFTVNTDADRPAGICNEVDCTLREAITAAQDGDLINFSTLFNTPQTINLLTALPDITRSITIQGTGANLLTVRRDFNAATEFRIFTIPFGITNGVAISGMTITGGNAADDLGGGIFSLSHLALKNVHVYGNIADAGGGVALAFVGGVFTNSAFSGNVSANSANSGGAINFAGFNGAALRVHASTVSGNRSAGSGGGISNISPGQERESRLEITDSTIADNAGGGILSFTQNAGSSATTTLRNTIVANNSPTNLATGTFGGGPATFQTLGFNLSNNYNGVLTPLPTDITNADPRLAPLALYGGQTPTHALLHGSPALNVGDASGQATDQRGQGRPGNGSNPNADIGAFEAQTPNVIIVNNINDSGAGSLRGAINTLLNVGDPDVYDIQFDSTFFNTPRTITLISADLLINGNMTILAPSADLLTVSGGGNHRVFRVNSGRTATLSGMTITGGNAGGGDGGGILNNGTLTITHSTLSGNTGSFGGGVRSTGKLTVANSTVSNNTADQTGGGIQSDGNSTIVTDSTISSNAGGFGGGIGAFQGNISTFINRSTITNNSALLLGSGVYSVGTPISVRNSIIAGNVNNSAVSDVFKEGPGTSITSNGFNLIGNPGNVTFGQTGDQSGTGAAPLNPLLGPLQNNGGTTQTHFLFEGSPALDKGNSSGATSDQRGQLRPVDFVTVPNASDGADIGAFEALVAPFAPVPPTVTYNPSNASTIVFPTGAAGTATSSIAVSSSGGVAPGTVNVSTCVAPAGFTITNAPINLTGTAGGAQISGSILLSCTRGAVLQSGTLACSETPTPGSTVTRNWTLTCPVADVPNLPPNLAYNPTAGSTISYSAGGTAAAIVVTPSGGSGSGAAATTTLGACTISNGGAAFPTTTIAQLGFVGATTTVQNLNLPNCVRQSAAVNATLTCPETLGTAAAVNRSWTLNCPAAPPTPVAPTVTYAPVAGSTINFPTGAAGAATSSIAVSSSGGAASGTVNVASCSAPAGFSITNAPINFTGTAGGAQISANINLSCTRGASVQTGTLSCSETPTPGSAVTRSWTLSCPVAAGDPIFGNGFEG
jgi:CSLREA domain-containing protein